MRFNKLRMKKIWLGLVVGMLGTGAWAQVDSVVKVPFEEMDLSWVNGQNRQKDFPLTLRDKSGETVLTGVVYMDAYFNYNLANPIDNTQTISSSIGRHKEAMINLASVGVESYYKNAIGRLWLQYGAMQHIVQELDGSVGRGRNTGTGNLKFIREAAAGYHFNKWHGINVEMGIFMSYIGLESYLLQENWSYQRSMVCDFTPFYFQGARIQAFPSAKLKTELWLLNGWQTYNSFSRSPGVGSSTYYRPSENVQLAANFYLGRDTYNPDTLGNQSDRMRFHHDHSAVVRYYQKPEAKGVSQVAFSLNNHYGFQQGDGVSPQEHFMYGASLANRIWFARNKVALTLRGDYVANGGQYLAFSPSPVVPNGYTDGLVDDPNKAIRIGQGTATLDLMPSEHVTLRVEYGHRRANLPYFAGHGGPTSPSGWMNGPGTVGGWRPDLRQVENRVTVGVNFRL